MIKKSTVGRHEQKKKIRDTAKISIRITLIPSCSMSSGHCTPLLDNGKGNTTDAAHALFANFATDARTLLLDYPQKLSTRLPPTMKPPTSSLVGHLCIQPTSNCSINRIELSHQIRRTVPAQPIHPWLALFARMNLIQPSNFST